MAPTARPYPSILLVVGHDGMAVADPRQDRPVPVTLVELDALVGLGEGEVPTPPQQARLRGLGLVVDDHDLPDPPDLDLLEPEPAGTEEPVAPCDLEGIHAVTPSVLRLHRGRPLAWDRRADGYRPLGRRHLRALAWLVSAADHVDPPDATTLADLVRIGLAAGRDR